MGNSKIEWTDKVWNPITGCSKVSPACDHCYAERMAKRLAGRYGYPKENPFAVTFHAERLGEPGEWWGRKRIFVCSMGDIFHREVAPEIIKSIFQEIKYLPQHIFMILTKRPERLMEADFEEDADPANGDYSSEITPLYDHLPWPKHLWLGVTAENQEQADKRIPFLLQIPAAVRFVSVEPMLGPVDLRSYLNDLRIPPCMSGDGPYQGPNRLNWVICGGETGPGARPVHPDWVRGLREQCQAAGVPFFFKQWGGKKSAGRLLDGRTWEEYPNG